MSVRLPPLPFCLPESPPISPVPQTESPEKLPVAPRTPRKSKHPRQCTLRDGETNSAIVRFQFALDGRQLTPTLKIRATTRSGRRSVLKARRRLWKREHEPLEFMDLESAKRDAAYDRGGRSDVYADSGDTDDYMDRVSPTPVPIGLDLSPPYSPQNFIIEHAVAAPSENSGKISVYKGQKAVVPPTKVKTCASCKTKKTPLWRDSEDGTPFCNACGIRFKKYRIRCSVCSYIPRKDEKTGNVCCLCSSRLVHCRLSGH